MFNTGYPAFSKSLTMGSYSSVPIRVAATLFPSTIKVGDAMLMTLTFCFLNTSSIVSIVPGLSSRAMVRRTPQHAFCQGVLLGCFASFPFAFCSCLLIFCFRTLSLSFLPLSPTAYLLFRLSLIFSPRFSTCV